MNVGLTEFEHEVLDRLDRFDKRQERLERSVAMLSREVDFAIEYVRTLAQAFSVGARMAGLDTRRAAMREDPAYGSEEDTKPSVKLKAVE